MNICPYRKARLKGQVNYIANGIVRSLQKGIPSTLPPHTEYERRHHDDEGAEVYWKERTSESWTPVRMVRIPEGLGARLKEASNSNVEEGYDLAHPTHGREVLIKFDSEETPAKMYGLRVGENTVLTDEELAYLRYPLSVVKPETFAEATDEWARLRRLLPSNTWQIGSPKMFDLMAG